MFTRFLAAAVIACLAAMGTPLPARAEDPDSVADLPDQPNIVVFYIDDTSPHDGRLWGASDELGHDPNLTPAIYDRFVANGIEFTNAIVENPLCCPARGNFLTGLHTHNNGVIDNDALLFDPTVHIGKSMEEAGYASMFVGKWLNRATKLSDQDWLDHQAGWTHHDVIYANNGLFNNYTLRTKQGDILYGKYHSTQMVADRTVMHINETPAETPVFAVLSIYNLHGPNVIVPGFKDHPKCAGVPPWNPGSYNEPDVSDKPPEIQALPSILNKPDGWPMVRYCEEMLGIDKAVGEVVAALDATGRLDNTLLVFTADNGIAWGEHRQQQQKTTPYTTPVPLYMSWPAAGWGQGTITEHTTNIDLAPTFCALADGCELTGYPFGQSGPDGVSLVPLIQGEVADLGREALLEARYVVNKPAWQAVRTTDQYAGGGRWHYVEYEDGFRELYDLEADPDELNNLAVSPGHEARIADLAAILDELRVEGLVIPRGSMRIVQMTVPAGPHEYQFTSDFGDFTLADEDPHRQLNDDASFANKPLGQYTFTQATTDGLPLASILCNGPATVDLAARTVTIDLQPNTRIDCTFLNTGAQPDAAIATSALGPFMTDDFYSSIAADQQTATRTGLKRRGEYDYFVSIQNDGSHPESFRVSGTELGARRIRVTYLNPADVTAEIVGGTFVTGVLEPGESTELLVHVKVGARAGRRAAKTIDLTVSSVNAPDRVDLVRAVARRGQ